MYKKGAVAQDLSKSVSWSSSAQGNARKATVLQKKMCCCLQAVVFQELVYLRFTESNWICLGDEIQFPLRSL